MEIYQLHLISQNSRFCEMSCVIFILFHHVNLLSYAVAMLLIRLFRIIGTLTVSLFSTRIEWICFFGSISHSYARCQDPLPFLNKVFPLIIQQEFEFSTEVYCHFSHNQIQLPFLMFQILLVLIMSLLLPVLQVKFLTLGYWILEPMTTAPFLSVS